MQLAPAQQLLCDQSHIADALSYIVLGPSSRNGFELHSTQYCKIREHKARVRASLRNLGSVVRKLKECQTQEQTQLSQHSLQQQQHSTEVQQSTQVVDSGAATFISNIPQVAAGQLPFRSGSCAAHNNADNWGHRHQGTAEVGNPARVQQADKKADPTRDTSSEEQQVRVAAAGMCPAQSRLTELQVQQKQRVSATKGVLLPHHSACSDIDQHASIAFSHRDQRQQVAAARNLPSLQHYWPKDNRQQETAVSNPARIEQEQQQQEQQPATMQPSTQQCSNNLPLQFQDVEQHNITVHQQQPACDVQHPPEPDQAELPGQQLAAIAEKPYGWWRGSQGLWEGIDPVRAKLLQVHNTLSNSSRSSTEQVLAALEPCSDKQAATAEGSVKQADQVGARLQRAWKQLQITGGAAAGQQQQLPEFQVQQQAACRSPQQEQQQQRQQEKRQSHSSLGASLLNKQHLQVRSQRLQQQQIQRQHQEAREKALAAIGAVFPTSPGEQMGGGRRVQRAAAAAAARVWQPGVDAEAVEEGSPAVDDANDENDRSTHEVHHSSRGKPPVHRPVKKLYQPKRADDDANWRQARFVSVLDHGIDVPAALQAKHSRPEHSTARFAVLVMLHNAGFPNYLFWERWLDSHPAGDVALVAHMKAGVAIGPGMVGHTTISSHKLKTSLEARWGDISLVEATIASIAETLVRCPAATHIALASGHDIPVHLMTPGVLLPGVSSFGMYQFGDEEQDILQKACHEELMYYTESTQAEADNWVQSLTFHHQWMVLCREHAAAVVKLRSEISVIGRVMHKACNSVKADMAPDEFIIITALRAHGYIRSIQRVEMREGMHFPPGTLLNCYPTMVIFPAESSPHPVLWTDPDEKVKCQLEDEATRQRHNSVLSLRRCLSICQEKAALFFRKVEIRQTRSEQQIELLSLLEQMWAGKGLKKAVGSKTSSAASGSRGSKRNRSSGGQLTKQDSKDPVARGRFDSSRGVSPMPTAAVPESDSEDDGHDVQSPLKKPATAAAVMAAAAAVAAAVSRLEAAPAAMTGDIRIATVCGGGDGAQVMMR